MIKEIKSNRFGEKAILLTWKNEISPKIIEDINNFKGSILQKKKTQIADFIIGYNSLLLKYNDEFNFSQEIEELKSLYGEGNVKSKNTKFRWEIPVCYDTNLGFDTENLSGKLNLSVDEIINIHSSLDYTVYFIGFLPGFLYLGGLDASLEVSRKATPLLKVPKGSVAIGGKQTGIYPQESAGGWHIIGRTPIDFFNKNEDTPCFAKSGDQLHFRPVSIEEYKKIEIEISLKKYELTKTIIHD
jgi:inhibitor of KinA